MNIPMHLTKGTSRTLASLLALLSAGLLQSCSYSVGGFDQPGLRGKLIDADTSQPVQGAVIYGYYATAEGSLGGGETIKSILHVFEVESNAEGIFEVPAWKTSWSITRGEPRQRFPAIAIYKDGYKLDLQNLATIAHWVSPTKLPGEPARSASMIDWTAVPAQLKPARTEIERYDALKNSNYAYADIGECGWEQHVKLLIAQHVANTSMKRRLIPMDRRNVDDMPKDAYPLGTKNRTQDTILIEGFLVNPAPLHMLRDSFRAAGSKWKCSNPERLLEKAALKLFQQ